MFFILYMIALCLFFAGVITSSGEEYYDRQKDEWCIIDNTPFYSKVLHWMAIIVFFSTFVGDWLVNI